MIYEFNFTGKPSEQTLFPGRYFIQCWGASGGSGCQDGKNSHKGGNGAYVSGILQLKEKKTFYIFVGGKGEDGACTEYKRTKGGYNGGGDGGGDTTNGPGGDDGGSGGGGATDIRLINLETDNNLISLRSRIIVAAGGSGSSYSSFGAPGGDIYGYVPSGNNVFNFVHYQNTSQTSGYQFGDGESGEDHNVLPSSGAGGGYYGGNSFGAPTDVKYYYKGVSSSGSSFISGYSLCNAVKSETDSSPSGSPIHYSNIFFHNSLMINGFSKMPKPFSPKEFEIGHEGDGVLIISTLRRLLSCNCNKSILKTFHLILIIILLK